MNENNQCALSKYFSTNPLSSNWFNIVDPQIIDKLPAIEIIPHAAPLLDRQAIKGVFKAFGVVRNEADGLQVTFPAASAGKMLYQSGTDIRAIASSFKLLFEKSIRAWDEKEVPMAGHKFHFNVSAYSNYVAKFRKDEVEYFIRFTIRKIGLDSSVHASTISEVAIYRKTEGIPADSHLENPEDGHRMPFIDNKIAFFLAACQLSKASKKEYHPLSHSNIHALLSRLHARLGDFWWYSLMIFVAARAADCLNVFVGLWLVPKYVGPEELGAVQPLTNLATFFALPAMIFASTFRNELSNLAQARSFGKMKTLMRSVFIAAAVFFFLSIIIARWVLPMYLTRLRIAEGSLGLIILASSFITAVAPVYTNALQSLKKLKALTLISLLGAPVRFLTMIVTMPLRALTGYFVGQCASPGFSIVASVFGLRKELSVKAEPYWNSENTRRFIKLFFLFGASAALGSLPSLVESTIIRQRLPELDSAAFYMITRFSEIAGFVSSTLVLTIFPFTAELAAKGKSYAGLVKKSCIVIFLSNAALALFFILFGRMILSFLPNGAQYADYWWGIPWLIGINALSIFPSIYSTAEVSANNYRVMFVTAPINILSVILLLCVTGYGYFANILPDSWTTYLKSHNITTLSDILLWITIAATLRLLLNVVYAMRHRRA